MFTAWGSQTPVRQIGCKISKNISYTQVTEHFLQKNAKLLLKS